jgi:hypothetical protein
MKTALRPDFFTNLPIKKAEVDKSGATEEEKFLYGMSQEAGFAIFTKYKDELLKAMDVFQETAISQGKTKEEIGENAILLSMVKGIINRLWSYTDDAKEACEGTGGK